MIAFIDFTSIATILGTMRVRRFATAFENNPLLSPSSFPLFAEIKAEHVVPGVRSVISVLGFTANMFEMNCFVGGQMCIVNS